VRETSSPEKNLSGSGKVSDFLYLKKIHIKVAEFGKVCLVKV